MEIKFFKTKNDNLLIEDCRYGMDGGGFEPPKALLTDLQSAPFGHSGTHPYVRLIPDNNSLYHIFLHNATIFYNEELPLHFSPYTR